MASLKDQYVDQVLDTSVNQYRRYKLIDTSVQSEKMLQDVSKYSVEGTEFGADDVEALAEGYCRFDTTATSGTDYELMQLISDLGWADVIVTE